VTRRTTHIEVSSSRGVFMISVAAELADMHPQTLRMYESRGLIEPKRSPKGTRLYSHEDIDRLRRIQQMTAELGLNLAGVERVLALEAELEIARTRLADLERQALVAKVAMEEELDRIRNSVARYEVVPYIGSTELVRSADARSPFKPPIRRPPTV
jgi:MerR family transcriptional regulator/heat shock protein HspR